MPPGSNRFICHFLILFLLVLLAMFGMYYALKAYANSDGSPTNTNGELAFAVERAFKVNLFVIDLAVLVIVETVLIYLFVRHTLPSVGITSFVMVFLLLVKDVPSFRAKLDSTFSPFVRNGHASLDSLDAIVLIIINTLVLAFMMTVLLKEDEVRREKGKSGDPQG